MVRTNRVLMTSMILAAASAAPALAITKYQANLVTASAVSPATNPTMTNKGKLYIDETGKLQAKVVGLTDGTGALVNTSQAYFLGGAAAMDGSEYIVILKGNFSALNAPFESDIALDVKKGNGTTKLSLASLFSLIPAGIGRSIEITGGEVWGPLGATNLAACKALVSAGFDLVSGNTTCRQGTKVGVSGVQIP